MNHKAIVFIAHGSRYQIADDYTKNFVYTFQKWLYKYYKEFLEYDIFYSYIELSEPNMKKVLYDVSSKYREIIIFPLLLLRAGHAKNDLPLLISEMRKSFPQNQYIVSDVLGVHHHLVDLVYKRFMENNVLDNLENTIVIFLGRGSSDPDANSDLYKLARLFKEKSQFFMVEPSFIGITKPLLEDTLDFVVRAKPKRIIIFPYLLFEGVLTEKIQNIKEKYQQKYPWIQFLYLPCLGIDELIFKVIVERINQSLNYESPLPCDNCKYRVVFPEQINEVGGLEALLWSKRHMFTHSQAIPNHSHNNFKKYVFICGNINCSQNGSIKLIGEMRRKLKEKKLHKEIAVIQTSCFGKCGEGPNMVVFPDGIWYKEVQTNDIEEIIENHFIHNKLVARLVDTIM
ncbi:MAG: ferredoxin [Leptospiraceae bacterium]|nr:MAG: ferredoxin [Leptospiraceae bacterium]